MRRAGPSSRSPYEAATAASGVSHNGQRVTQRSREAGGTTVGIPLARKWLALAPAIDPCVVEV
jgi:hypothetical protein